MSIPYTAFFTRLCDATGIRTQTELARALGVHRSAITQAKLRDAVPQKWILALARRYTLSPDWLEYGKNTQEAMPPAAPPARQDTPFRRHEHGLASAAAETQRKPFAGTHQKIPAGTLLTPIRVPAAEIAYIPKVRARLCAGGGSFEIEAVPVEEYPFPRQWLSRMGTPSAMAFMDVIGDSMEPSIFDGDMVLVDQSGIRITPHAVYAVGVEDAVYIKRIEQRGGGIILHSDNPAYSDMELYGDELGTFRVIGKVVWLCRDLR